MTEGPSPERPVLWGEVSPPVPFAVTGRNNDKVDVPSHGAQGSRLGGRFDALEDAFAEQIVLAQSLGASDPQLVVVFEAVDERADLARVAELSGLEVLTEVEREYEPDPNFPRRSKNKELPVSGCLHAICLSATSRDNLLTQWRRWRQTGQVASGYAPLRDIFAHLKDVRAWGPQDRVRVGELATALAGMLPDREHTVEVELWYRGSATLRKQAQDEVTRLLHVNGGRVISAAQVDEVGYHGVKCTVPVELLQRLAGGDFDAVEVVRSSHVMYLRATAQSYSFSEKVPAGAVPPAPLPTGDPVLCVLDGVPVANHPRLAGRVIVYDSDDLAENTSIETDLRQHGTAMASVCVWGDLSTGEAPATRPVLVRPILTPSDETQGRVEEVRSAELVPDLMRRIFRELFDGSAGADLAGSSIVVLNLSVGDPAAPFDGLMSSWARTIDWLSATYGVLVVVSAGNHGPLEIPGGVNTLTAVEGVDRADAVNAAVARTMPRRSLLSPAESLNALTVGALNSDGAGPVQLGYRLDPADGQLIVNPTSALGAGNRRSVKPDLLAPGGRALFQQPMRPDETEFRLGQQSGLGPGIRVAASNGTDEIFTMGSSPAAALVSREAARAVDTVVSLADRQLTRAELAVATKALVAHSARIPEDLRVHDALGPFAHGYGAPTRTFVDGCEPHEASILYVGDLGANEESTLSFPLPDGLQQLGVKRVTATLAWMSPINWKHRQYRRAALDFSQPVGFTKVGTPRDVASDPSKRGTLQHTVWEINRTIASGMGDTIDLTVHCKEQAGGLNGQRVDFAVVLSLWVAPTLNVDVYTQVQQQVSARVGVTPGS